MKIIKIKFLITLLATIVCFDSVNAAEFSKVPHKLKISPLVKTTHSTAELGDEFTLMQFWASWCVGCGPTMKKFSSWSKNKSNISFLPVSIDDSMSEAKSYFTGKRQELKPLMSKAYLDKGGVLAEKLGVQAIPTVLLVDSKGQVVYSILGHPTAKDMQKIESIIEKKNS